MFTVYNSNKLNVLKNLMMEIIKDVPIKDPFKSEYIIIQNNHMSQWLKYKFINKFGILINIKFLSLYDFIFKIFFNKFKDFTKENFFIELHMTWKILDLLIYFKNKLEFKFIKKYFNENNLFKLAKNITHLFKKYMIYRPDWLISWLKNKKYYKIYKSEYWQIILWNNLINENSKISKLIIYYLKNYIKIIKKLNINKEYLINLPKRIFIFCIYSIPPILLQILHILSSYIDIYMFFKNPFKYYYENIINNNKNSCLQKIKSNLFKNKLLVLFGKQVENDLYLLSQLTNIIIINVFINLKSNSLLTYLQKDILLFNDSNNFILNNNKLINNKRILNYKDNSLSINICYNKYSEIEILYENLLFNINNIDIFPKDIIVLIPNIDSYVFIIKSIFNKLNKKQLLPYIIYNNNNNSIINNPIFLVIINLLKLSFYKFTVTDILSLLEVSALSSHFFFDEEKLTILNKCIIKSGIYWGLDYDTYLKFMLSNIDYCDWRNGLYNILIEFIIDNNDKKNISFCTESTYLITSLISNLSKLLIQLRYCCEWFSKPRLVKNWLYSINYLIDNFFSPNNKEKKLLDFLKKEWKILLQSIIETKYKNLVSISVILKEFINHINHIKNNEKFSFNNIIFCDIKDFTFISFRIIFLLGMNNENYSFDSFLFNFDLIYKKPRFGDPDKYNNDRYLFFNILLSAKKKLYISFNNYTINNNLLQSPSLLISELINYILNSFCMNKDISINLKNKKKNIYLHLFKNYNKNTFLLRNFLYNKNFNNKGYITDYIKNKLLPQLTSKLTKIYFDDILNFYKHPVKFWFIKKLNIFLKNDSFKLITDEPFIFDKYKKYKISKKLINIYIKNKNTNKLYNKILNFNKLSYGVFNKIYLDNLCKENLKFSFKILKYKFPFIKKTKFILKIKNTELYIGNINIQINGLFYWKARNLYIKDILILWLKHLIYCISGGKGVSRILGFSGEWCFYSLSINKAKKLLFLFISGFKEGVDYPLLLLYRSGEAWLKSCYNHLTKSIDFDKNKQIKAKNKLIETWFGNNFFIGEKNDLYLQKLIPILKNEHISKIINLTKTYLLPLFIFKQNTFYTKLS